MRTFPDRGAQRLVTDARRFEPVLAGAGSVQTVAAVIIGYGHRNHLSLRIEERDHRGGNGGSVADLHHPAHEALGAEMRAECDVGENAEKEDPASGSGPQ